MPSPNRQRAVLLLLLLLVFASATTASAFRLSLSNANFQASDIQPTFSGVRNFSFEIDLTGPLVAGQSYANADLERVEYLIFGSLNLLPPTPSGFPGFRLDRTPAGEGIIVPSEWVAQDSSIAFEIARSANLMDGLQLSELVADASGILLRIDGREFQRLDRARYHPPQLLLYSDGSGILQNSNNSSGATDTTNPATMEKVDVDFGEEYVTGISFDPGSITVVVPEPGTTLLLGIGLALLGAGRGRRTS